MAVFAYVYYNSYVAPALLSVGGVLSQVMKLEPQQLVGWGAGICGGGTFHCHAKVEWPICSPKDPCISSE
jgi:hypothetical protein